MFATLSAAEKLKELGYPEIAVRELSDGRVAWVHQLLFTSAILIGSPDSSFYEDRWCYHTQADAIKALREWDYTSMKEPEGWHRNPTTGRRRPDGDPKKEFVDY